MIEKLKAPFWFGLPGYAWLAGVVALVGGGAYFLMHRSPGSTGAAQGLPVLDNSGVLNPYPSGGGTPVPPGNPISPNGGPPPPYDLSRGMGPRGIPTQIQPVAHTPMPPSVQQLSQHEKEWLKLHPDSTMAAVEANDAAWRRAHG